MKTKITTLVLSLFSIAVITSCGGCKTDTGNPSLDRAARVTNATLSVVGRAVQAVAIQTILNAGSQAAAGEKIDFAHAASQGLYQTAPTIVDAADVASIVSAWSGGELNPVAAEAAKQFSQAAPQTECDRVALANVIAKAISSAAIKSTK